MIDTPDRDNVSVTPCKSVASELSQTCGWAGLLGEALSDEYGLCLATEAISGTTTQSTRYVLPAAIRRHRPRIVILGLAPANEGLAQAPSAEAAFALGDAFVRRLRALADEAASFEGVERVVLGGVYPHGHYSPTQAAVLQTLHLHMQTWPYHVIDFLGAVGDGHGGWRDELRGGPGGWHPNRDGYRVMFEAARQQIEWFVPSDHPRDADQKRSRGQAQGKYDKSERSLVEELKQRATEALGL